MIVPIAFTRTVGRFVDLRESVQADDNMRDAERLRHLQHDTASYDISRPVDAVGVVWLDVELGEQASLGTKWLLETVDERRLGSRRW